MNNNDQSSDQGPELEEFPNTDEIRKWLEAEDEYFQDFAASVRPAGRRPIPPKPPQFPPEDRHQYRPSWRPPVPILTVLDDGSAEQGESHRIRKELTTIGRSSGDVRVPNDPWISARHAEIHRLAWQGGFQWHLHDCGSSNGTFVRCTQAILHETAVVILGSRRFQLQNPLRSPVVDDAGEGTRLLKPVPEMVWPELVEVTNNNDGLRIPLRRDVMMLGRTGEGAHVEIDDPLLAYQHATLRRQQDGTWLLIAKPTRNGVWISTTTVALTSNCRFRCGEQLFWFVIP